MARDVDIHSQGRRFVDWLSRDAFPAWQQAGFDDENGHSFEWLLPAGAAATDAPVRIRTQARQLFALCVAHDLHWVPDVANRADALHAFIVTRCRQARTAGFIRSLSADLSVSDAGHDLYDHACFLLASAWRYRAFGDESAIETARTIMRFLDAYLAHPAGGWSEGDYDFEHRRQNPHMHLFESSLALFETTGAELWRDYAGRVYALFTDHFYDPDSGHLLEFFDDALQPAGGDAGRTAEPGHMMEWVWLLRWYERLSGTSTATHADRLFENALEHGRSGSGLLYDAIATDGGVRRATKRLWPMAELIKAALSQARAGHADAEQVAAEAIADFFTHFVDTAPTTLYVDQLDAQDAVIDGRAAASSMYHLTTAAIEIQTHIAE